MKQHQRAFDFIINVENGMIFCFTINKVFLDISGIKLDNRQKVIEKWKQLIH